MGMGRIPTKSIKQWEWNSTGCNSPLSIDTRCAYCDQTANHVRTHSGKYDDETETVEIRTRCVRCDEPMLFWIVKPPTSSNTYSCEAVYSFPDAPEPRYEKFDEDVIPQRIFRAYQDAIRAFDAGIWDATATMCGKALEGITKTQLPKEQRQGSLGAQLQKLPDHVNLAKPFLDLADVIRGGRNIGAHFDVERETDREMAEALLQLVEHVLEYIYVFEARAKEVNDRLTALNEAEVKAEPAEEHEPL